jgi:hypothetical protein
MPESPEIDAAIATREAHVAKMRRELEIAEAELRGMKLLRDQIVGRHVASRAAVILDRVRTRPPTYTGGRQPGSISKTWRQIYSDLFYGVGSGNWFSESQLIGYALKRGVELRPKDAKERLQAHAQHGLVEEDPFSPNYWRVTDVSARTFGFSEQPLKEENESVSVGGNGSVGVGNTDDDDDSPF